MERQSRIPHCARCHVSLGVRLDRGMFWSWEQGKWFDLCKHCAHAMFQKEFARGLVPDWRGK